LGDHFGSSGVPPLYAPLTDVRIQELCSVVARVFLQGKKIRKKIPTGLFLNIVSS